MAHVPPNLHDICSPCRSVAAPVRLAVLWLATPLEIVVSLQAPWLRCCARRQRRPIGDEEGNYDKRRSYFSPPPLASPPHCSLCSASNVDKGLAACLPSPARAVRLASWHCHWRGSVGSLDPGEREREREREREFHGMSYTISPIYMTHREQAFADARVR